ncbi:phage portal protein [Microvirga sp.]|uniref:phage portal protein n=1 Tax=Microvirga sp. TaxID=1873136 RepID=UPI002484CF85|nr:phage portal protein [Microvirga sp.]
MGRGTPSLLLEAGLKAKLLAAPGREQQFHEARVLSLEDVARIYGVPLSVVGLGKNASYGSLTEESRALRQNCFAPWAGRVEAQLRLA